MIPIPSCLTSAALVPLAMTQCLASQDLTSFNKLLCPEPGFSQAAEQSAPDLAKSLGN